MSRTHKDHPSKLRFEEWNIDRERIEGTFYYIYLPTTKTKKRRGSDTEWHWMSTPSWWTRLTMNRPQRRAGSIWERTVTQTSIEEIDLLDTPSVSRKPHQYYW